MSNSFNELTFSDISLIDKLALYFLTNADSFDDFCQGYYDQSLMPLSMHSFKAYFETTKQFLFAVGKSIYGLIVSLLSFVKSFFLIFENKELENLIDSIKQMCKCIGQLFLDVIRFSLLCTMTLITLPIRIMSSVICYAMAINNYCSINPYTKSTDSNFWDVDTRINLSTDSVESKKRNSFNSFECENPADKKLKQYYLSNPCCV